MIGRNRPPKPLMRLATNKIKNRRRINSAMTFSSEIIENSLYLINATIIPKQIFIIISSCIFSCSSWLILFFGLIRAFRDADRQRQPDSEPPLSYHRVKEQDPLSPQAGCVALSNGW